MKKAFENCRSPSVPRREAARDGRGATQGGGERRGGDREDINDGKT